MPRVKVEQSKEISETDVEIKIRSSRVKLAIILSELRRLTENLNVDGAELQLVEQNINQNMVRGKTLITVITRFQSSE